MKSVVAKSRFLALCGAILFTCLVSLGSSAQAVSTVTIKATLTNQYKLLAVSKSGKSYSSTATGGKVSITGIATADTEGMTLSIISKRGAYVGPVIFKYVDAKNKAVRKVTDASKAYLNMKKQRAGILDLKEITLKTNYAYLSLTTSQVEVTNTAVSVTGGVPPARTNLGMSKTKKTADVFPAATPTVNNLGEDADNDGLPSYVDVDDDNDGKLDLVDDKFFATKVKKDAKLMGDSSLRTALICGGNCANLSGYGVTNLSDRSPAATAVATMINTFQGVFFTFEAVKSNFISTTPASFDGGRNFGYFNVDCTGISWCSGSASGAITISPDYDSGDQPENNALPLAPGRSTYSDFCGNSVIAKDPTQVGAAAKPSLWTLPFDASMDEWVFSSCDPDGDGFPNIIPSKGTIGALGDSWLNEIKPRMAGPDGMKVGDTIGFRLTSGSGALLASSTQVLSGVIQTAPCIVKVDGVSIHTSNGTCRQPSMAGKNSVTFTFWRPQRSPIGTETSWQDVGGLRYSFQGPSGQCTIESARLFTSTNTSGTNIPTETEKTGSTIVDIASDATPNVNNVIQITADLTECSLGGTGQWKLIASDRANNSTMLGWNSLP